MAEESVYQHNLLTLESLTPGDLIEFDRGFWSHWGVYVGAEMVVHMTVEAAGMRWDASHCWEICQKQLDKAHIIMSNFWQVVGDERAYKNNSKDLSWRADDELDIVWRAINCVGEIDYNLITFNCEHFATWCRYGRPWSAQMSRVLNGLRKGSAISLQV